MVANYTTVARVVTQLGWIDENGDRPVLNDDSIPTSTEVTEMIEDAESMLESFCRTAWRSVIVTDERHSSPELYNRRFSQGLYFQLRNRNIRAITELNIWEGEGYTDLVATGTIGTGPQDGDYFTMLEEGLLFLHNTYPSTFYEGSVKITYTYGKSTIPNGIRRATTLLAAAYAIESNFDWVYSLREGVEGMPNDKKSEKWEKRAFEMADRFKEITPIPQW